MELYAFSHNTHNSRETLLLTKSERDEMMSRDLSNVKIKKIDNLPGFSWKKGRGDKIFCDFGGFRYIISSYTKDGVVSYIPTLYYKGASIWTGSKNGVEKDKAKALCWKHRIKMIGEILS